MEWIEWCYVFFFLISGYVGKQLFMDQSIENVIMDMHEKVTKRERHMKIYCDRQNKVYQLCVLDSTGMDQIRTRYTHQHPHTPLQRLLLIRVHENHEYRFVDNKQVSLPDGTSWIELEFHYSDESV